MKFRLQLTVAFHRFAGPSSLFFLLGFFITTPLFSQLPTAAEIAGKMKIGWNIGNSLEVPYGETGWGNPKVSQTLIDAVSKAGFNTIRIPCSWDSHANKTTMEIDLNWFKRVREVIDYCYADDLYIILNCHWDSGWLENNVTEAMKESVNKKQKSYWTQIAENLKDYDEHLLFAGANEPNVDNAAQMAVLMSYHQTFIDAVRSTGGNNRSRVLVVQGPSTDIDKTNQWMTSMPADQIQDRLMAEIHYYTPWNFCGLTEDASWGKMFYFWGQDHHSTTNPTRNATWGEESTVESLFQSMKIKFVDRGIPVILGEYGVVRRSSLTGADLTLHLSSREYYYEYVTNAAIRHGLIPVYWDNGANGNNTMALFNRTTGAVFDPVALQALQRGAGINTSVEQRLPADSSPVGEYVITSPNPVTSSTAIQFFLKEKSQVNIFIYNILGKAVAELDDLHFDSGFHSVNWHPGSLAAGPYFIKVHTGDRIITGRVLVVK